MQYEQRCFPTAELRFEEGDKPRIEGYAVVWDSLSEDLGDFRELFRKGAFSNILAQSSLDCRALINHDKNLVLGRTTSGTLRMREDDRGLAIEIDPPDTSYANDLMKSMGRGDISGMSFRFFMWPNSSRGQVWRKTPSGILREITEAYNLVEVSIVTFPAYPDTSVAIRSLRDFEKTLHPVPYRRMTAEIDLLVI
jgi:uncharacterized protein